MIWRISATHDHPPWPIAPSQRHCELALDALVRLHTQWWEAATLGHSIGHSHTTDSLTNMVHGIAAHVPAFIDAVGDAIDDAGRAVLQRVFASSLQPWLRLTNQRALTWSMAMHTRGTFSFRLRRQRSLSHRLAVVACGCRSSRPRLLHGVALGRRRRRELEYRCSGTTTKDFLRAASRATRSMALPGLPSLRRAQPDDTGPLLESRHETRSVVQSAAVRAGSVRGPPVRRATDV